MYTRLEWPHFSTDTVPTSVEAINPRLLQTTKAVPRSIGPHTVVVNAVDVGPTVLMKVASSLPLRSVPSLSATPVRVWLKVPGNKKTDGSLRIDIREVINERV